MKKWINKYRIPLQLIFMTIFIHSVSFATMVDKTKSQTVELDKFLSQIILFLQIVSTLVGIMINTVSIINDFRGQSVDLSSIISKLMQTVTIITIIWYTPKMIETIFGATLILT